MVTVLEMLVLLAEDLQQQPLNLTIQIFSLSLPEQNSVHFPLLLQHVLKEFLLLLIYLLHLDLYIFLFNWCFA